MSSVYSDHDVDLQVLPLLCINSHAMLKIRQSNFLNVQLHKCDQVRFKPNSFDISTKRFHARCLHFASSSHGAI